MPIQFRCTNCQQKLAISRRKAGQVVTCPACAADLHVPTLEEAEAAGQITGEPPAEAGVNGARSGQPASQPATDPHTPRARPAAPETSAPGLSAGAVEAPAHQAPADDDEEEEEGFHLGRRTPDESGLDMTPMVDVTFLLLIFFMITASFSIQKSMEADPPKPEEEGAAQLPTMEDLADDSVIVEIDENNIIYVDDAQVGSISELVDALALKVSGEGKLEMIIEPHPQSKHGTVVQVTDAGIEVGMQRIRRVIRKGD